MNLRAACAQLRWYWNRLANMGAREIAYRMVQKSRRVRSRRFSPDVDRWLNDETQLPSIPGFGCDFLARHVDERFIRALENHADAVGDNRFRFLGIDWPDQSGMPDWHLDPITGRRWPGGVYCFDISYRHDPEFCNVKYLCELGRLQYLQPVAALAALREDEDLAQLCIDHLSSWIDENPPFRGVHWDSGIELALRAVSILLVMTLLRFHRNSATFGRKILRTLANHGYWLARFPSAFSSANNHLVAESGALFLLGSLLPDFEPAESWRSYGRETLEREVLLQFHDDGVGAEQSPTYSAFSLEWFILCSQVATKLADPFSEEYRRRVIQAGEFLRNLMDQGGNIPHIGDNDEGHVVFSQANGDQYVASVLSCLASATNQAQIAPPHVELDLLHALIGVEPISHECTKGDVSLYASGGYTIVRSFDHLKEMVFVFDHGPLGSLAIAAHGHADALAVWLHIGGRPVVIDAGTYRYRSDRMWRNYLRSTRAHNTLSVEGDSSSVIAGDFNWSHKASVQLIDVCENPETWCVEAEHDGFVRKYGCRHRRRVEGGDDGCCLRITDRLVGKGSWNVEIGFLFAPDLDVKRAKDKWVISRGTNPVITLAHQGPLSGMVDCGLGDPRSGWSSSRFNSIEPSARLVFKGKLSSETEQTFGISLPRAASAKVPAKVNGT